MKRRAFLSSAGAIALAGCTASGDDGQEYVVHGLEESNIYHDAEIVEQGPLDDLFSPFDSGADHYLFLEFGPDEFDSVDYDIYLMDGDTVVSKGQGAGSWSDGVYMILFKVQSDDLADEPTYRVVMMNVVEHVDDFEVSIEVNDRE